MDLSGNSGGISYADHIERLFWLLIMFDMSCMVDHRPWQVLQGHMKEHKKKMEGFERPGSHFMPFLS